MRVDELQAKRFAHAQRKAPRCSVCGGPIQVRVFQAKYVLRAVAQSAPVGQSEPEYVAQMESYCPRGCW